jgi:capsular exopolysaccharide synthesis family protein
LDISVSDLLGFLSVQRESMGSLINIGVTDTDPERAAIIANRIAQELIVQTSSRSTLLDIEFLNTQIEDIQNQITRLQNRYTELLNEAETLTSAFDLSQNLGERNSIEATIRDLRTLLLSLLENAPQSEVQMFEPAVPDYYPITSNSVIDLVIAGGVGGVLSILTIVLFTFFDDRLQWNEIDHEMVAGQRVLGPLGIIPRSRLPLYVDTIPNGIETEALRQVRAKIALANGGRPPRVMTVVSYDSGEGKTLTSANIALETARSGLRTLVIDADMRRGDLHEVFRLPNVFGLSDVLVSNAPLESLLSRALLDSGYENLALLPFGRAEADPAALLGRPRFTEMIEILAQRYDSIVIDAVPTIGGPDAVFLAEASDGIVIVVNTRRTRLTSLRRTVDELTSSPNVNIFGVIFNRVRLQVTTKYNNKYYYRQTVAMNPDRLSREMQKPQSGLAGLRAHIIRDAHGERLYSIKASAARLGVKQSTVQNWIATGFLSAERRMLRRWVRESALNNVMAQRQTVPPPEPESQASDYDNLNAVNGTHEVPNKLREQRDAILDFAQKPKDGEI